MVRSDVQLTAPCSNWTQLSYGDSVIKKRPTTSRMTLSCNTRLRAGIWICYALEIGGFGVFLARV